MFENILCQDEIIESLASDLSKGTLPSALLLWGPEFSGKMSVALEIARVLSCAKKTAEWSCDCKACESQRVLAHPYTLLLGGRYFVQEAAACAEVLRKAYSLPREGKDLTLPARYLFIRALRKLLRRFDAALWEGKDADLKKLLPSLVAAEEAAQAFLPDKAMPEEEKTESLIAQALEAVKAVCETTHLETVPIDILRNASSWAYVGASGAAKIIIIENADKIQERTHNTLLKILEEPPPHATFILTAVQRTALLPTILSRIRTYRFLPRSEEANRQVLSKIFRKDSPAGSVRDFFRSSMGIDSSVIKACAKDFLAQAVSRKKAFSAILAQEASWFTEKARFRVFLSELADTLRRVLRGEEKDIMIPLAKLEECMALIRRSLESLDIQNVAPQLLAQRLYNVMGAR